MSNTIRLGLISARYGTYEKEGLDGLRGAMVALSEFDWQIAGKRIELIEEGTTGVPDDAYYTGLNLITSQGIDVLVGPLGGNEGLAIKSLAVEHPNVTFLNGSSGAQNLTFPNNAPNFFNFALNGAQAMAGVGRYAYEELGYRRVVTLGENYSWPHAQIGSFVLEFCRAGGEILERYWVPLSTKEYGEIINQMPDEADAIVVSLGGSDAHAFLEQYATTNQNKPLVASSILLDESILTSTSHGVRSCIYGAISGSIFFIDNPAPSWQAFMRQFLAMYPEGFEASGYTAVAYYTNMKAALLALDAIDGDLSLDQRLLQQTIRELEFEGPNGSVYLDEYQHAVGTTFITTVVEADNSGLHQKLEKTNHGVDQFLGLDESQFASIGAFSQDIPTC